MNLPNKLTMARMAAIPFFIACFYLPAWQAFTLLGAGFEWRYLIAGFIFILAYVTDTLDGRIARKYNLVTDFGKLMDPIADKLLTAACMIMLIGRGQMSICDFLMPVFTVIVIAREFMISGMRLVAASKGRVMAAGTLGKIKTTLQSVALPMVLIAGPFFRAIKVPADFIVLAASVVMTIWSGLDYMLRNRELFKAE
ncbi:MAG: CDP-diacylglycerol--glycerol-3-phosphate 3-phosphatidyltransferase [Clostridia bacterium]|nr:CDP-diacylglycerol--glycerol-3-phosphate 3-phosphatidyltransferase [Clostridia bacterium]MBQ4342182.1 CDP-diacylglycerol--glycerol-3-phosphate 3-phosphatidyltransferase [Clostridia bacterium]